MMTAPEDFVVGINLSAVSRKSRDSGGDFVISSSTENNPTSSSCAVAHDEREMTDEKSAEKDPISLCPMADGAATASTAGAVATGGTVAPAVDRENMTTENAFAPGSERIGLRRPSPATLRTHSKAAWDALWEDDDNDDGDEDDNVEREVVRKEDDYSDNNIAMFGEEKREITVESRTMYSKDPRLTPGRTTSPRGGPKAGIPRIIGTPPLRRIASTPLPLSAGRHSFGRHQGRQVQDGERSQQTSAIVQDHRDIHLLQTINLSPKSLTTTSGGGGGVLKRSTTVPRPSHHRKNSVPRLGMLQSAQDLASAANGAGIGGVGDLPSKCGREDSTGSRGDQGAATRSSHQGEGRDESKNAERPFLPPLSLTGPSVPFWEGLQGEGLTGRMGNGARGGGGGGGGGWVSVGGVAEEARKLRARANSFIGRLPGPKKIMQALEDELDVRKVRLTAQSEPIILMEVMPAAMVASLLLLTYFVFAAGVGLIVRQNLEGTSTLRVPEDDAAVMETCYSFPSTVSDSSVASASGCIDLYPNISSTDLLEEDGERYGAVFSGFFAGMTDLYGSVSLHVSIANDTALETLPNPAVVDLTLEACTELPREGEEWGSCDEDWAPVLNQSDISVRIRSLPTDNGYTIFNFYQNQETIPGQALIRQYQVQIGFVATENVSISAIELSALSEASWALHYEKGATEQWARVVLACVLVLWLPVWLSWCYVVFYRKPDGAGFKNALHERKWLAFLGLSVALYLNPIMVVGNFVAPASASWGLASEMSSSVATAVFLVVVLCIADGIARNRVKDGDRDRGSKAFYFPKIAMGGVTLVLMLMLDLMGFPSLTAWERGSLQAVQNWPESERRAFIVVASARITMVVFWGAWMICRIYISGSLLRQLSYVPTRYQQLSYRFFGLQAFLLGVVYLTFALWRLVEIVNSDLGGNTVAAEFMLFIKTRQDHLGSVSLLCAYALQLLLLYLPASLKESVLFRDIALRFVYFEAQLPLAKNHCRKASSEENEDGIVSMPPLSTLGDTPRISSGFVTKGDEEGAGTKDEEKPLFCVETAAWLLEVAWETYNDPEGFENPNKYHFGVADFGRVGFELVAHIFNAEHDTHCFVLQDKPRARLVIAFRGSVGTKHWRDNLRFLQTEFNLEQMMPRGRESEAPEVLAEDIDIHAAETLRDVVADIATRRDGQDADEGDSLSLSEGRVNREIRGGSSSTDLCTPAAAGFAEGVVSVIGGKGKDRASTAGTAVAVPATASSGSMSSKPVRGDSHSSRVETPGTPSWPPKGSSSSTVVRSYGPSGITRSIGSSRGGSLRRDSESIRSEPISPSGIRAILKGFALLPWQLRDTWDQKIATFSSGGCNHNRKMANGEDDDDDKGWSQGVLEEGKRNGQEKEEKVDNMEEGGAGINFEIPGSGVNGVGSARSPRSKARASEQQRLSFRRIRLVRSHSMSRMEERKRGGGGGYSQRHLGLGKRGLLFRHYRHGHGQGDRDGHRGQGHVRSRSVSFDDSATLKAESVDGGMRTLGHRGVPWQGGAFPWRGTGGGGRDQQSSPGVMEGLGRGLVRRGEDLVRGTEAGLDRAARAARRGLEAADNAAHVMGINRIPVLRQYLWGQVHTGFWNSYEAVRGEVHATVRKTLVDWLLTDDHPPDIKVYVTGHSMGGALGTHCAMDLQLHTVDKIKARLGNFVRVRRTLLQRVIGSLPRRLPHLRQSQHHQQQHQHRENEEYDVASEGSGGGAQAPQSSKRMGFLGKRIQRIGSPPPSALFPSRTVSDTVPVLGTTNRKNRKEASAVVVADEEKALGNDDDEVYAGNVGRGGCVGSGKKKAMRRVSPCDSPAFDAFGSHGGAGNIGDDSRVGSAKVMRRVASSINTVANALDPRNLMSARSSDHDGHGDGDGHGGGEGDGDDRPRGTVELQMFSFGAPRVGNSIYAARYNDVVPHSFRVVVDGDPVPGVPSWWYTHVGTKVLIDGRGRGSLIMDPSFVEKRFFVRSKRYVLSHLIEAYQAGLRGNLLQAVPPNVAKSLPPHWPFGVPDDDYQDPSPSLSNSLGNENFFDAEGSVVKGPISPALSVKQADIAQHAVDALHEAEQLNRAQPFRIVTGAARASSAASDAASVGGGVSRNVGKFRKGSAGGKLLGKAGGRGADSVVAGAVPGLGERPGGVGAVR